MKYVEWVSDAAHSELNFKVKHLMISNVTGSFENFTVSVESDDDNFSNPRNLQFSAEVASIDTGNAQRDEHLKSADFFDIEEYSTISFIGTSWDKSADKNIVYGDLQIKGVTKSMSFDVETGGVVTDPYGQIKAGFSIAGSLSRGAYGLLWNEILEGTTIIVADEIKFYGEIQLIMQQ